MMIVENVYTRLKCGGLGNADVLYRVKQRGKWKYYIVDGYKDLKGQKKLGELEIPHLKSMCAHHLWLKYNKLLDTVTASEFLSICLEGQEAQTFNYKAGFKIAEDCFNYSLRTGKTCPGSAPYVYFVEAVAWSMKSKEDISPERIEALEKLLQVESGSKFNQGVYDFLMEKIREYRTESEKQKKAGG